MENRGTTGGLFLPNDSGRDHRTAHEVSTVCAAARLRPDPQHGPTSFQRVAAREERSIRDPIKQACTIYTETDRLDANLRPKSHLLMFVKGPVTQPVSEFPARRLRVWDTVSAQKLS